MHEGVARNLRASRRYDLRLPLHYRVSQKGQPVRSGSGTTCDMSTSGVSFRCRKPLPIGAHVEITIDWPAAYDEIYGVALQVTGFIVRSDGNRTAARITSHRFKVSPAESVRASA